MASKILSFLASRIISNNNTKQEYSTEIDSNVQKEEHPEAPTGKSEEYARNIADFAIASLLEDSPFFKSNPPIEKDFPVIDANEIQISRVIGEGALGTVREVTCISDQLLPMKDPDAREEFEEHDCCMEKNHASPLHILHKRCHRNNGDKRYIIKRLREDIVNGTNEVCKVQGLLDIVSEYKFLSCLHHPNIITLRGTVNLPGEDGFMLLFDKLTMTLEEKVGYWKKQQQKRKMIGAVLLTPLSCKGSRSSSSKRLLYAKLLAAYDISRALQYLHKHNILYRDLKPENIAFNHRGDIKIFDFGLAREAKPKDLVQSPEDYNLTGVTGTRRWMAPEVCLCKNYGFSADVYSFGLLFWYICTLQLPFAKVRTPEDHYEQIIEKRKRPHMNSSSIKCLSKSLQVMMKHSWDEDRSKRPSFKIICCILKSEISELRQQQQFNCTASINSSSYLDSVHFLDRTNHLLSQSVRSLDDM